MSESRNINLDAEGQAFENLGKKVDALAGSLNDAIKGTDNLSNSLRGIKNQNVKLNFENNINDSIKSLKEYQDLLTKIKDTKFFNKNKESYFQSQEQALNSLTIAWNKYANSLNSGKINGGNMFKGDIATTVLRYANAYNALYGDLQKVNPMIAEFANKMNSMDKFSPKSYTYAVENLTEIFNLFKQLQGMGVEFKGFKQFEGELPKIVELSDKVKTKFTEMSNIINNNGNTSTNASANNTVNGLGKIGEKLDEVKGKSADSANAIKKNQDTIQNEINETTNALKNLNSEMAKTSSGGNGNNGGNGNGNWSTGNDDADRFINRLAKERNMEVKSLSSTYDTTNPDGIVRLVTAIEMYNNATKEAARATVTFNTANGEMLAETTRVSKNFKALTDSIQAINDKVTSFAGLKNIKLDNLSSNAKIKLVDESHLSEVNSKISDVISQIDILKSRGTEISKEEETHINKQINDISNLIKEYKNAESVKGKLSAQTFAEGKKTTFNNYENLIASAKKLGVYADDVVTRMTQVKESINSVDKTGLDNINDKYKTFRAEVTKLKTELSNVPKFTTQINALKNNGADYSAYTEQFARLNSLMNEYKVTLGVINATDDMVWIDGQKDVKVYEKEISNLIASLSKVKQQQAQGWVTSDIKISGSQMQKQNQMLSVISDLNTVYNYGKLIGVQFNKSGNEIVMSFKGVDNVFTKIRGRVDDVSGSLQTMTTQSKGAAGFFGTLGSMMQKFAGYFSMYFSGFTLVLRLFNAFRDGANSLKEYDSALTTISYTMDVTKQQLNQLGENSLKMAKNLRTSTQDALSVAQIYANINESIESVSNKSKNTLVLSNLTGMDAEQAASDIQAVLQSFNYADDQIGHVVDVYDKISASIAVDYSKGIEGIAEAVQTAGQTAKMAGVNFEQLSAIVAKAMEVTRQEGSQIGNGLKTIMTRLSKVGELTGEVDNETLSKASDSLHKIGIEVYNLDGSYRQFDVIMTELANKWDTLTDAEKANLSFNIAA